MTRLVQILGAEAKLEAGTGLRAPEQKAVGWGRRAPGSGCAHHRDERAGCRSTRWRWHRQGGIRLLWLNDARDLAWRPCSSTTGDGDGDFRNGSTTPREEVRGFGWQQPFLFGASTREVTSYDLGSGSYRGNGEENARQGNKIMGLSRQDRHQIACGRRGW
jgi:hypothetical protein